MQNGRSLKASFFINKRLVELYIALWYNLVDKTVDNLFNRRISR